MSNRRGGGEGPANPKTAVLLFLPLYFPLLSPGFLSEGNNMTDILDFLSPSFFFRPRVPSCHDRRVQFPFWPTVQLFTIALQQLLDRKNFPLPFSYPGRATTPYAAVNSLSRFHETGKKGKGKRKWRTLWDPIKACLQSYDSQGHGAKIPFVCKWW